MSALDSIDTARRDLFIAAEYKGMSTAAESAHALAKAHADLTELVRCASGIKNALDLSHGVAVYRQWARSLNRALVDIGEIDVPAAQAAAAERHDAWADLLAVAEEAVIADSAGALRDYNMTRLRSAVARVKESP